MHQTVKTPPVAPEVARKRRARRKRYIIFGSIGLVLLVIIASVVASKREKPIPVTTEKAVRKTILQTVSATGKVQPETEVKISPEVAGEIIDLPVEDGKAVNKGDLLVRIKPDSYKALLEQQEAAISSAKATNLQQKATMMKTEQDLKRADDMFAKKTISIQEYNAAQAAYDVPKTPTKVRSRNRARASKFESGARSTFEDNGLFADRWDGDDFEQQIGRTHRGDGAIRGNGSDARGRSRPHGSARGCERERRRKRKSWRQGQGEDRRVR
jgi:Multidrug resistance efflux pump